jgi:hypothetical protein
MGMIYRAGTFATVPLMMVKGLPPTAQIVFCWICYHCNQDGVCWPSLDVLCEECGIKKRTAIYNIKILIERGHLKKTRRPNRANVYELIINDTSSTEKVAPETYSNDEALKLECTKNSKPKPKPKPKPKSELFEKFWAAYPRKKEKGRAIKTFNKINPSSELVDKMIEAIYLQEQERKLEKGDIQYVRYGSTWLNDAGWKDEVDLTIKPRRTNGKHTTRERADAAFASVMQELKQS